MDPRTCQLALFVFTPCLFGDVPGHAIRRAHAAPPDEQHLAPLAAQPLPLGAIKPAGWLRKQLQVQAAGLEDTSTNFGPMSKTAPGSAALPRAGSASLVARWLPSFGRAAGRHRVSIRWTTARTKGGWQRVEASKESRQRRYDRLVANPLRIAPYIARQNVQKPATAI